MGNKILDNKNPEGILIDLINRLIYGSVNTALPGIITKVDDISKQKVSVKIMIKKKFDDGESLDYPEITDVPLIIPSFGDAVIKPPVSSLKGIPVLLVFAQRSLGNWLINGENLDPPDKQKFSIKDAIAIPGLNPFVTNKGLSKNDDFEIIYKDSSVVIEGSGRVNINNGNLTIEQ